MSLHYDGPYALLMLVCKAGHQLKGQATKQIYKSILIDLLQVDFISQTQAWTETQVLITASKTKNKINR